MRLTRFPEYLVVVRQAASSDQDNGSIRKTPIEVFTHAETMSAIIVILVLVKDGQCPPYFNIYLTNRGREKHAFCITQHHTHHNKPVPKFFFPFRTLQGVS
jgi:hypothetical protein